jgi:hypothetical protein
MYQTESEKTVGSGSGSNSTSNSKSAYKCLGKNTSVLMYDGSIKLAYDIKINDQLMGDDSTPRNVLNIHTGSDIMFRVYTGDTGEYYTTSSNHPLCLRIRGDEKQVIHMTTREFHMFENIQEEQVEADPPSDEIVGYRVPVEFQEKEFDDFPYSYGRTIDFENTYPHGILAEYKYNSQQYRIEFLKGVGQTNGFEFIVPYQIGNIQTRMKNIPQNKWVQIPYIKCSHLRSDIIFIICSLGYALDKPISVGCPMVFSLKNMIYKIRTEERKKDEYYGIETDGNRRFLLGDFTVVHNQPAR